LLIYLRPALAVVIALISTGCQVSRVAAPISTRQLEVGTVKRIVVQPALSPASFSPDGRRIAFSTQRGVRVADLAGSSREVTRAKAATAISWSPRLGLIAYVEAGTTWTMRNDGRGRARVPLPGVAVDVSWSRGGDKLAVVLRRIVEGTTRYELWLANRDGGFRRLLTRAPAGRAIRDIQWFGDSLYLLYGLSAAGSLSLERAFRIRIAYPDRREIPIATPAVSLRLAPYGERVAYVSGPALEEGRGRVLISRLDGTGRVVVTPKTGTYSGLAWSPQGDKLAFAELTDEANAEIWVVDADGSGRLHISSYAFELPDPRIALSITWSPDGRHLVYGTNTGRFTGPLWLATLERR
jgi:WD40 repeat protein